MRSNQRHPRLCRNFSVLRDRLSAFAFAGVGLFASWGCGAPAERSGVEVGRSEPKVSYSGTRSRQEAERRARIAAQVTGRSGLSTAGSETEARTPDADTATTGVESSAGGSRVTRPAAVDPVSPAVTGPADPESLQVPGREEPEGSARKADHVADVAGVEPEPAIKEREVSSEAKENELTDGQISERVRALIERLQGDEREAATAFREVWTLDARLVPHLLREVGNRRSTQLRQLDILVRQKDFARYDEAEKRWYYIIKGLGRFELDDIAMNKVYRNRGREESRVRLKSFDGFELGLVIRAGLLNRFYSVQYPRFDESKDLVRWWQDYYRRSVEAEKRRARRAG